MSDLWILKTETAKLPTRPELGRFYHLPVLLANLATTQILAEENQRLSFKLLLSGFEAREASDVINKSGECRSSLLRS